MRYKAIKAMSHDWTYWFMSGLHYIDGRFVFEDVRELARARPAERVTVSWIPPRDEELESLTPRIRQCVNHMRRELPGYLRQHGIDGARLAALRTEVYVAANSRLYVRAFAEDDRGREYASFIPS